MRVLCGLTLGVLVLVAALGGETSFAYDANGNLLSLTDARGKQTVWAYDDMDRATSRRDPLLRSQAFEYDLDGNLVEATDRERQARRCMPRRRAVPIW